MPIEVTWYGHAAWSIVSGGTTILVDPFLDDSGVSPIKAADVQADFILITHGHSDHVGDTVKIAKRTKAPVVANWEICEWFGKQGVKERKDMNTGGWLKLPFGMVKLTIAHHSSTLPDGTPGGNPNGFLLSLPEGRIYIAGDTALTYDMKLYAGGLNLAILPIGDLYTMGIEDSVAATNLLEPRNVAPSHYNTWPPIAQDANAWAAAIKSQTKAEPIVPQLGQPFVIA